MIKIVKNKFSIILIIILGLTGCGSEGEEDLSNSGFSQEIIANAGNDKIVNENDIITFDGTINNIYNLNYKWSEVNITLSDNPIFAINDFSIGTHNITLTITTENGNVSTDNVIVKVEKLIIDSKDEYNNLFNESLKVSQKSDYISSNEHSVNINSYITEKDILTFRTTIDDKYDADTQTLYIYKNTKTSYTSDYPIELNNRKYLISTGRRDYYFNIMNINNLDLNVEIIPNLMITDTVASSLEYFIYYKQHMNANDGLKHHEKLIIEYHVRLILSTVGEYTFDEYPKRLAYEIVTTYYDYHYAKYFTNYDYYINTQLVSYSIINEETNEVIKTYTAESITNHRSQ